MNNAMTYLFILFYLIYGNSIFYIDVASSDM